MIAKIWSLALMGTTLAAGAQVVGAAKTKTETSAGVPRRAYLVKLDGREDFQSGAWYGSAGERLRSYAQANRGSYIVFSTEGTLYRISDGRQLQALTPIFESLRQLGKQQAALGSVQQPLGEQQQALSSQMRSTSNPATQGQIGAAQGSIGRVQGEIGRQQGIIGKQQGELGALVDGRVQLMIDACLQEKSCTVVEAAKPSA